LGSGENGVLLCSKPQTSKAESAKVKKHVCASKPPTFSKIKAKSDDEPGMFDSDQSDDPDRKGHEAEAGPYYTELRTVHFFSRAMRIRTRTYTHTHTHAQTHTHTHILTNTISVSHMQSARSTCNHEKAREDSRKYSLLFFPGKYQVNIYSPPQKYALSPPSGKYLPKCGSQAPTLSFVTISYGVATMSRRLKIIDLLCRI